MFGIDEDFDHTHECRNCDGEIECHGDGETCWQGGNDGCENWQCTY